MIDISDEFRETLGDIFDDPGEFQKREFENSTTDI